MLCAILTRIAHQKYRPFLGDHNSEKLILKTFGRDHEVKQGDLGCYLGQVVRVSEFGRDVEPEVSAIFDNVFTEPNDVNST